MALVVARTRKADGEKVYWSGQWWYPSIVSARRFATEAEAKEAVAAYKLHRETRDLKPTDTTGYSYLQADDVEPGVSGPSGNVFVRNYTSEKDTTPNGYRNDAPVDAE